MFPAEFHTIGCKLNQTETAQVAEILHEQGVIRRTADDPAIAPRLFFVNTCAVTTRAAAKSRQLIARLGREHPDAVIIAAGCLAQHDPESLKNLPAVKYILGTETRLRTDWWRGINNELLLDVTQPADSPRRFARLAIDRHRARPFLKIQDGCDFGCSFCIIPSLRGAPRSVPPEEVIAAAQSLSASGAEEIVLTGVRIGAWGRDLPGNTRLINLLCRLLALPEPLRIRLGSLEPWEVSTDLVEFVLSHPRICPHLHIPLQHTVPSVLAAMGRPALNHTRDILIELHRNAPFTAIGADIITGFPGETDDDFRQLVADLDALPLTYLHAFSFSPRPGTPAAHLHPGIPGRLTKERVQTLLKLNHRKKAVFAACQLNRWLKVIPDYKRTDSEWIQGVTENYLHILVPAQSAISGKQQRIALSFQPQVGFVGQPL